MRDAKDRLRMTLTVTLTVTDRKHITTDRLATDSNRQIDRQTDRDRDTHTSAVKAKDRSTVGYLFALCLPPRQFGSNLKFENVDNNTKTTTTFA